MTRQIALISVPLDDVSDVRPDRVCHEVGFGAVLGNRITAEQPLTGEHLDFRIGERRYRLSIQDLMRSAAAAIEVDLKREAAARVLAARAEGRLATASDTAH